MAFNTHLQRASNPLSYGLQGPAPGPYSMGIQGFGNIPGAPQAPQAPTTQNRNVPQQWLPSQPIAYSNPAYNDLNVQQFEQVPAANMRFQDGGILPQSYSAYNSDIARFHKYNQGVMDGSVQAINDTGINANLTGAGTKKGSFWGPDGFNLGSVMGIADTLAGFGQLYQGFQQNKLAKKAFNAQQDAYRTNLANEISSYNLALEDRMQSRYSFKGKSPEEAQEKIDRHKL